MEHYSFCKLFTLLALIGHNRYMNLTVVSYDFDFQQRYEGQCFENSCLSCNASGPHDFFATIVEPF